MITDSDTLSVLTDLGLSVLQAKIYLTLLTQKSTPIRAISYLSKVSRPDVYRVIAQLEELKLVRKTIAKPARYEAVPIRNCTSFLVQKQEKKLLDLKDKIPSIISKIDEIKTQDSNDQKDIDFKILTQGGLTQEGQDFIINAKESILAIIQRDRTIAQVARGSFMPLVTEALKRNVEIHVVIVLKSQRIKEIFQERSLQNNFKVKFFNGPLPCTFGIRDRKEVIISTKSLEEPNFQFLWSDNKCMVDLCIDYFNRLWNSFEN